MSRESFDVPSSQESLGLSDISASEFQRLADEVAAVSAFSSDGEFSEVAKAEVQDNPSIAVDWENITSPSRNSPTPLPNVVLTNEASGSNPSMQEWPGELDFQFRIAEANKAREPQYSPELKKLFINMKCATEIFFRIRSKADWPNGLWLRAVPVFTKPDDFPHPVKVCPSHSLPVGGKLNSSEGDHLITCLSEKVVYGKDRASGRNFVLAEFSRPQPGCSEVGIVFKFMDLGSCPGGINRRDTAVIFTLEQYGQVIGRQILSLRICTSPRRDLSSEVKQAQSKNFQNLSLISDGLGSPLNIPVIENPNKRKPFWILVHGEENYKTLKNVAELLERKDGGDMKAWHDAMSRHNQHQSKPKKIKLEVIENYHERNKDLD